MNKQKMNYLLIVAGILVFIIPTYALSMTIVPYTVTVIDTTTGYGVSDADIYIWAGGGSTTKIPETAEYHMKTNIEGSAYFSLESGFYIICANKNGYTSNFGNDLYSYAGAAGVGGATPSSYVMEVYPGIPDGDGVIVDGLVGSQTPFQIAGLAMIIFGAVSEYMQRKKR